jgi:serine protein kinase
MGFDIHQFISKKQDLDAFKKANWSGSFQDYVNIVTENPKVCRNAYQRMYDMILSWGVQEGVDTKKKVLHYNFFDDPEAIRN